MLLRRARAAVSLRRLFAFPIDLFDIAHHVAPPTQVGLLPGMSPIAPWLAPPSQDGLLPVATFGRTATQTQAVLTSAQT